MSFQAQVLNVLIASPSDVQAERDEVEQAIYEWNSNYSEELNVVLLPRRWEKDVTPAYRGSDPQQIINEQIVDKCDILIGIFWTKLGSPTLNHSSGTLEEIHQFIEVEKDVMLYFVDKPVPRSNTDYIQMQKVDEFKNSYKSMGIYATYSAAEVVKHLYRTVTNRYAKKPTEEMTKREPVTPVDLEKLITWGHLTDNELLLLTFTKDTGVRHFGDRWKAETTIKKIDTWKADNRIDKSDFTDEYSNTLAGLAERGILTPTDFTSYGNAKDFTMGIDVFDKLRNLSSFANIAILGIRKKYTY